MGTVPQVGNDVARPDYARQPHKSNRHQQVALTAFQASLARPEDPSLDALGLGDMGARMSDETARQIIKAFGSKLDLGAKDPASLRKNALILMALVNLDPAAVPVQKLKGTAVLETAKALIADVKRLGWLLLTANQSADKQGRIERLKEKVPEFWKSLSTLLDPSDNLEDAAPAAWQLLVGAPDVFDEVLDDARTDPHALRSLGKEDDELLKSSGMSPAVARSILAALGDRTVDPLGGGRDVAGMWRQTMLLLAKSTLGKLSAKERAQLGNSPVLRNAGRWIQQVRQVSRRLDYGGGLAALAKKDPDFAKFLGGVRPGLDRAWLLYAERPALVVDVLAAPDMTDESMFASPLDDPKMPPEVVSAVHRMLPSGEKSPLDLQAKAPPDLVWANALLLLTRINKKPLSPEEAKKILQTPVGQVAADYLKKVRSLGVNLSIDTTALDTVMARDPAYAKTLKAAIAETGGQGAAWKMLVERPDLFQVASWAESANPYGFDHAVDSLELPVALPYATENATVAELSGLAATSRPGDDPVKFNEGYLTGDSAATVIKAVAAYVNARGDDRLDPAEIEREARKGTPGAAVLRALLPLLGGKAWSAKDFIVNLMSTLCGAGVVKPEKAAKVQPLDAAYPPHASFMQDVMWSWRHALGTTEPLRPLAALIDLWEALPTIAGPGAKGATIEQVNAFLQDAVRKDDSAGANFMLMTSQLYSKIVPKDGGLLTRETLEKYIEDKLGQAAALVGTKVPQSSLSRDSTLNGWMGVKLWFDEIFGSKRNWTQAEITAFIAANPRLPPAMVDTLNELSSDATFSTLDKGFEGNVLGKVDGEASTSDTLAYIDSRIKAVLNQGRQAEETDAFFKQNEQRILAAKDAMQAKGLDPDWVELEVRFAPPTFGASATRIESEAWADVASDLSVPVDIEKQKAVLQKAVAGGKDAFPTNREDAVHLARAIRDHREALALVAAGKSGTLSGFSYDVKLDGTDAEEKLLNVLSSVASADGYQDFVNQYIAPEASRLANLDPSFKKTALDYAKSVSSESAIRQLADDPRMKKADGTTDWDRVFKTVGQALGEVMFFLSPEEAAAINARYLESSQKIGGEIFGHTIDSFIEQLMVPGREKSFFSFLKFFLKELGIEYKPGSGASPTQIGLLVQRVIRTIGASLRMGNAGVDAADDAIKGFLTELSKTGSLSPTNDSNLTWIDADGKQRTVTPENMQEFARYYNAQKSRGAPPLDLDALRSASPENRKQMAFKAWLDLYGSGEGAGVKRKVYYGFKKGYVHLLAGVAGAVVTAANLELKMPSSPGDYLKTVSGFLVMLSGFTVFGAKYFFNEGLDSAARAMDEGASAGQRWFEAERANKSGTFFKPWAQGLDLKEGSLRILSGVAYGAYAAGSVLNYLSGKYVWKPTAVADLVVNSLAGFTPALEGIAQLSKHQVRVAAPLTAVATRTQRFARSGMSLLARLYAGSPKAWLTRANLVLAVAQVALIVIDLAGLPAQMAKEERRKKIRNKVNDAVTEKIGAYYSVKTS